MKTIKAIETSYKGYKFRSRLEARWAVFFDWMGLQWLYEPEGVVLPSGAYYLPDFRVTSPQGMVTWYEVKPEGITSDEKFDEFEKVFSDQTTRATLLSGDPYLVAKPARVCPRCGTIGKPATGWSTSTDGREFSFGCWPCDADTEHGGGHPDEIGLTTVVRPHKGSVCGDSWREHAKAVQLVAEMARSARFEHGAKAIKPADIVRHVPNAL